ncbi:MAG: DUF1127 domain-containing protein [Hyphomicrobiaceae bacterium]
MNAQKCDIGAPYGVAEHKLPPALASAASAIASFVTRIAVGFSRYLKFRAAERELQALDDRMLKDIGIDRSEIRSALINASNARRTVWRI